MARLRPVATYIRRRRHHIAKTIEGRTLLEECRGAERRSGSSSRLMWWQQEMDLKEGDGAGVGGGGGGVLLPHLFTTRREMSWTWGERTGSPGRTPAKTFLDRPGAASPDHFNRGVDLDG